MNERLTLFQKQEEKPAAGIESEWEEKKRDRNAKSEAIDKLMKMTGMESVKERFVSIFDMVSLDKERKLDFTKKRYSIFA